METSGRVLKAMKDSLVNYYDACESLTSGSRKATSVNPSELTVSITPNPGYGQWNVSIIGSDEKVKLVLEITDALGGFVDKRSLESNTEMKYINENLNLFVYTCRIIQNGITVEEQKLEMLNQ